MKHNSSGMHLPAQMPTVCELTVDARPCSENDFRFSHCDCKRLLFAARWRVPRFLEAPLEDSGAFKRFYPPHLSRPSFISLGKARKRSDHTLPQRCSHGRDLDFEDSQETVLSFIIVQKGGPLTLFSVCAQPFQDQIKISLGRSKKISVSIPPVT